MTNGTAGAGVAAAQHAIANAVKSFGVVVTVENRDFLSIIQRTQKPLVVMSDKSFWSPNHKYISNYKGLTFFTKSRTPLNLPGDVELVTSKEIRIPS
jgi:hypothetical protein